MIVVFPNNKLISTDSILPVLLELKMRYDTNSELVFFDRETYLEVNKNIVLRDVINYVGRCTYIDKTRPLSIYSAPIN